MNFFEPQLMLYYQRATIPVNIKEEIGNFKKYS